MKNEELNKYLPGKMEPSGLTYQACLYHFCEGLKVADACSKAGVSRQAAHKAIKKIRAAMFADGYKMRSTTRVEYFLG